MYMNFNNVVVKHKDHTISIAQHKKDGKTHTQEIMVWGPKIDFTKGEIIRFGSNGPWLVEALQEAIAIIDKATEE